MLHYPKIPDGRSAGSGRMIAFEKYDGTNLHFDWDRDFGWHSFGTRRDAFNLTPDGVAAFVEKHAELAECNTVFHETLAEGLERIFRSHPAYRERPAATVFAEFLGPNSFAGKHKAADPKELRLFDVQIEGIGMLGPRNFVDDFGGGGPPTARVVYEGKLTGKFTEEVRDGKWNVAEGVVCKGGSGGDLWMVKIKTNAYLERLKQAFADRWEDYWE